jgi:hypothetical protein
MHSRGEAKWPLQDSMHMASRLFSCLPCSYQSTGYHSKTCSVPMSGKHSKQGIVGMLFLLSHKAFFSHASLAVSAAKQLSCIQNRQLKSASMHSDPSILQCVCPILSGIALLLNVRSCTCCKAQGWQEDRTVSLAHSAVAFVIFGMWVVVITRSASREVLQTEHQSNV